MSGFSKILNMMEATGLSKIVTSYPALCYHTLPALCYHTLPALCYHTLPAVVANPGGERNPKAHIYIPNLFNWSGAP